MGTDTAPEQPFWDDAFAEVPPTPTEDESEKRLRRARRLSVLALWCAVAGLFLPVATIGLYLALDNPLTVILFNLIPLEFMLEAGGLGTLLVGPLLAIAFAVTVLVWSGRKNFTAAALASDDVAARRSATRGTAIAALVVALLLPVGGAIAGGIYWGHLRLQDDAWATRFDRQRADLDRAAAEALPAAKRALAGLPGSADLPAVRLSAQLQRLSAGGTVTAYGSADKPCLYFSRGENYDDNTGYGYAYCVDGTNPEASGLTSVRQLDGHWWIATDNSESGGD